MERCMTMEGLLRAQDSEILDAARNGSNGKRGRTRTRKPIRLPVDVWEEIDQVTTNLQAAFPLRYVTRNSVLEFLIQEGLEVITEIRQP